tara:strand:+ start:969 stop:1151 length:183 start_codon:yes stop_codon:yes gene_type:complete
MTLKDENEKLKRLNGCLERESNHRFNRINTLVSKLNKLKDENEILKEAMLNGIQIAIIKE